MSGKLRTLAIAILVLALGTALLGNIPRARATVGYDVGTSTDVAALYDHMNRKIIYDGTYFWLFYWDGTVLQYRYSTNGITWAGSGNAWAEGNYGRAAGACVEYNSPYVYVVTGHESYTIWFIRGSISGTTITWGSSVRIHNSGTYYNGLGFCRLANGRLLVTYHHYATGGNAYYSDNEGVNWSSLNDGTSATITSSTGGTVLVAMTSSKAMAFWKDSSNSLWYTRYASGAWGTMTAFASTTLTAGWTYFSATASGDVVWLVYLDSSSYLKLRYWTDATSTWSSVESPYGSTAVSGAFPTISVDVLTGMVYVFWAVADNIYYVIRYTDGSYSSRQTLITETTDTITENSFCISFNSQKSTILVAYTAKTASPYVIRTYFIHSQSVHVTYYISGVSNSGKVYVSQGISVPINMANGTVTQYGNQSELILFGLPAYAFSFHGWSGTSSSNDNPWSLTLYTNRTIYATFYNTTLIGNATEGHVMDGYTFYNNSTTLRYGTFVATAGEDSIWFVLGIAGIAFLAIGLVFTARRG